MFGSIFEGALYIWTEGVYNKHTKDFYQWENRLFATFNTGLHKFATFKIDFVKMPFSLCTLWLSCHFFIFTLFLFLFFIIWQLKGPKYPDTIYIYLGSDQALEVDHPWISCLRHSWWLPSGRWCWYWALASLLGHLSSMSMGELLQHGAGKCELGCRAQGRPSAQVWASTGGEVRWLAQASARRAELRRCVLAS